MMAELAIWMAGYTTVAIFPTEGVSTIAYVLEQSESRLIFIGKLDSLELQESSIPSDLPRIALPLSPSSSSIQWDEIVAITAPLQGRRTRRGDDWMFVMRRSASGAGQ